MGRFFTSNVLNFISIRDSCLTIKYVEILLYRMRIYEKAVKISLWNSPNYKNSSRRNIYRLCISSFLEKVRSSVFNGMRYLPRSVICLHESIPRAIIT